MYILIYPNKSILSTSHLLQDLGGSPKRDPTSRAYCPTEIRDISSTAVLRISKLPLPYSKGGNGYLLLLSNVPNVFITIPILYHTFQRMSSVRGDYFQ